MRERVWMAWWGGAAAAMLGSVAAAQTQDILPALKWVAQKHLDSHASANDELVDIVYWVDTSPNPDEHWIYATGFVTEMNGNGTVRGTRMVTYKYDAAYNGSTPTAAATAYYPPHPGTGISQGDTYKAVAMTVDSAGNIYITGEGPHTPGTANDQDYYTIKYDKDLALAWTGSGARTYDGGEGDDIPADIIVFNPDDPYDAVVVTGTSPGDGTGDDIATAAWYGHSGGRAADLPNTGDYWPDLGWGDGVRRYNNDEEDGDDRAVELARAIQTEVQDEEEKIITISLDVIVLGTSFGGSTQDDFTTHFWRTDGLVWDARFDLGGNDVATGLSQQGDRYYSAGYSEIADSFNGGGEGGDSLLTYPTDYSIAAYINNSNDTYTEDWRHNWDYSGGDDFSSDVQTQDIGSDVHVWITGEGESGSRRDVFTIHYLDDKVGTVAADWEHGFNAGGTSPYNYGKALALESNGTPKTPYITGANGSTGGDWMLTLKYRVNPGTPPPLYTKHWNKIHSVGGFDEGRAIFVKQIDGTATNFSIWIAGTQSVTGEGREAAIWKYRE